jgi:hypothetical protein
MSTEAMKNERRLFLKAGLRFTLAASVLPTAAARATLCVDPEELSSTDYSFRKYVHYTESSLDPEKPCRRCASFIPPTQGDCGTCKQVAGSINANGHCDGWEARPQQ